MEAGNDPWSEVLLAVRGFYARKDVAHDLSHALRVGAWVKKLAREEGVKSTTAELAALVHDIGRPGAAEPSHAGSGAALAESLLRKCGYSDGVVAEVKAAVAAHSREAGLEPRTEAAILLYDADKLDFVGPVGLARLFAYGSFRGWPLEGENSCESFYRERIRGYYANLGTEAGKRHFAPLLAYMEDFWQKFHTQGLKEEDFGNHIF
ncbi:HD/PDEase domain protein [Acididesulfobacillus acetoxydans]|uniref:HD/PDEase domain protein n=1 Tax=Acididesulfobacillus acetoxydans TaxID=1561005 RepID=A0A8S0WXT8_9FIRM|nr:HD domain-containing protein [Acididesulfobacillus acetoxydans]CAA7601151.1 HD/PDEase domain protein [Acididesulfobacillus acetoxydans]CEJ08570.1 Metal dependent phosphohydrolase [Acididesulfobacillus acetoxydans]